MYRYLDRPIDALAPQDRFLVTVMRDWVAAARAGRCGCHRQPVAFHARGIAGSVADFGILMMTLNRDGLGKLRFGARCGTMTTPDEARLLALFATAGSGSPAALNRVAATLVTDEAIGRLTRAAGFVATALAASAAACAS